MGEAEAEAGTIFGGRKASPPNGAPSALTATVDSDTAITLNWTIGSTNHDGHRIYISTDGVAFSANSTVTGATATKQATGLTAGTLYYFYVVAYKGAVESTVSNTVNALTWTAVYKVLDAALTGTKPSATIAASQNLFISRLQGNNSYSRGTWVKIACIIPYTAGMPTASDALFWWNDPTRKAALSATTPTYEAGKGFTGNGSSSYIDTTFNCASDGNSLYTQNDACFALAFNNYSIACGSNGGINSSNEGTYLRPMTGGNILDLINNGSASGTAKVGHDNHDLYFVNRTAAEVYKTYKRNNEVASKTTASVAPVNGTTYDLALLKLPSTKLEYSADTVGLRLYASSLDETDRQVIIDAYDELYDSVNGIVAWTEPTWQGSGVCFCFDDSERMNSWIAADTTIRASIPWKASFFIDSRLASPDSIQWSINRLRNYGHEMVNHSFNHIDWITYLQTHTVEEFYNTEIATQQAVFDDTFSWTPNCYGYAAVYGNNEDLSNYIINQGYKRVRPAVVTGGDISGGLVYQTNASKVIWTLDFWVHFAGVTADLLAYIDYAKTQNAILVVTFHSVEGVANGKHNIILSDMQALCQRVVDNEMTFYRLQDIPVAV